MPDSQVAQIRYVYENASLVECALDRNCLVAINALEHCRVAVGYNDTHLLFADSWGHAWSESNKLGTDVNKAGISVMEKWLVYNWMRDVVLCEPTN